MDALQRKEVYADTNLYADLVEWIEAAKKEFVTCCEPNHYIRLLDGRLPLEDCPNYKWFKKWFGEAK